MTTLYQLDNLLEAIVVARPSKSIKSPYVADIIISSTGETALAHTPALGCCGLSDKTSKILVAKSKSKDSKCDYVVYCAIVETCGQEAIVGIHPKMAETITENALKQNYLKTLQNVQSYKREQTVICGELKSRFDFTGVDESGCPFIMEVKSVPLCLPNDDGSQTAFFPDGYRKKKGDVVSPRALKHIQELEEIVKYSGRVTEGVRGNSREQSSSEFKKGTTSRCIMCYVIQRSDVCKFQTAATDPEYKQAVKKAHDNGVEIITLCIDWTKSGTATMVCCDLPFEL